MTDFEKTTERKGEEAAKAYARELGGFPKGMTVASVNGHTRGWDDGRNSLKEDFELAVRALEEIGTPCEDYADDPQDWKAMTKYMEEKAREVLAKIKASGNWPLEGS